MNELPNIKVEVDNRDLDEFKDMISIIDAIHDNTNVIEECKAKNKTILTIESPHDIAFFLMGKELGKIVAKRQKTTMKPSRDA